MSPMKLFSQGMLGKLGAKDETRKRYFSDETRLIRNWATRRWRAQALAPRLA